MVCQSGDCIEIIYNWRRGRCGDKKTADLSAGGNVYHYDFNSLQRLFLSARRLETSVICAFAASLSVFTIAASFFTCVCRFSSIPASSSLETGSEYLKLSASWQRCIRPLMTGTQNIRNSTIDCDCITAVLSERRYFLSPHSYAS